MTICFLLEALKQALEREFQGLSLKNEKGEPTPINFFMQNLPAPAVKGVASEPSFPFIVIRYTNSEDTEVNDSGHASVLFVIGVYDEDSQYQGYKDVINIQEKIRQTLLRTIVLKDRYTLEFPLKCSSPDDFGDSSYPKYYGAVESRWLIPAMIKDWEEIE